MSSNGFVGFTNTDIVSRKPSSEHFEGNQNDGFSVVRFADGSFGIEKSMKDWVGNKTGRTYPAELLAAQEYLAARVGQALDTPIRDCLFTSKTADTVIMPFIVGQSGKQLGGKDVPNDPQGIRLQIFDHLVANSDRRPKNLMFAETGIVGIDHALCNFRPRTPKVELLANLYNAGVTSDQVRSLEPMLETTKPYFAQLQMLDKYENMLLNLASLVADLQFVEHSVVKSVAKDAFTPPQGVQDAAKKALEWMADGKAGDGFTSVGRKRASDLARGASVSEETIRRMKAYFDRHQPDKKSPHWDEPSPGKVAWYAWGGDAGYSWAKSVVEKLNKVQKGDDPGHPFHGNQWTTGEAGVKDLSQRIDTVDMTDIEAWRNRRNGGGTTTTRTPSAPKPAPAPRAPRPAPAPKPQTAPKAPQTPSTAEKGLPAGWHTVSKADGRITLKSDAGNSAVFSTRGSWKPTDPEAHTMLQTVDKYATGKTINFAPKDITRGTSNALGYVNSKNPNTVEIMPKSRVDGALERTTSNFKTGGNPAMEQALRDAHDKSISASSFANQHASFTCFASKDKALEAIVTHELGHSDFFSRGLSMDSVYKGLASLGGHLNEERLSSAERQGYRNQMGRNSSFRMPDGTLKDRAGALDWLMKNGSGGADLRGTAVASWIAERGMSKYGTTSLADTVAEAYCAYRMPELPKTDVVNALAGALGWTQKAVSSENAPTDWSGGVGFTDGFDGPTMILGDKAYDYATGEWSDAFEPNPELADDTPKGEVKKGDIAGHEFHGNQYEQGNGMNAIEAWRNRRAGGNTSATPKAPAAPNEQPAKETAKSAFVGLKSTEIASKVGPKQRLGGAVNNGFNIVKLKDGSTGIVKHNPDPTSADAEILSARIGKVMGVPIRDAERVPGSATDTLHPYIEGHTLTGMPKADQTAIRNSDEVKSIQWLDLVTGNYDRNNGNIMVQKDGSIVGIDGGNAFHGAADPGELRAGIGIYGASPDLVGRTNDAINSLFKMTDLTDNQKNIVMNEIAPSWQEFWNNGGSTYASTGQLPK